MIYGVGTDITDVERIGRAVRNPRFISRVFTQGEVRYCGRPADDSDRDGIYRNKQSASLTAAIHYAGCWAAKEAVAKSVGIGFDGFSPCDIEIVHDENGKPRVELSGRFRDRCGGLNLRFYLSIAHSDTIATATCIAVEVSQ
jgi:holo-[acyl-carrier protein] synthase